ncbi:MAG: tRNA pseudouridine(55) synthase TruB [Alphaproteobacteria bacterium]|jgi:tRNA pseudouridine55 synthase|nr:tRNA pseudouridine(55) synthase TruB [Alphaproteobacteria bacterium]
MGRKRRQGRPINGWLVIDKARGETSTGVVSAVRRLTQAQKAGHGGTLDPLATGVLPIALGEATKTVPYVVAATKAYRFEVRFGEARDTDDAEGEVIATADARPDDAEIAAALGRFRGAVLQTPPRYAAVKVEGERAYDLARRGETVELAPRPVEIHALELVERPSADRALFEMTSGKGAYVRAVARDLGDVLGCHGHVTALRRLAVGGFHAEDAVTLTTLERLVEDDALPQALVSLTTALADIPALAVTEPQAQRLRSGQPIRAARQLVTGDGDADTVRVQLAGEVVALGRFDGDWLAPVRVFNL